MKLSVPEDLKNSFDMLMKSVPPALQSDDQFRDTALVYLKLGGMTLARHYIDVTKKYLNNDPLQTGLGLRFPKITEPKADDEKLEDESDDEAQDEDEDVGDEDDDGDVMDLEDED